MYVCKCKVQSVRTSKRSEVELFKEAGRRLEYKESICKCFEDRRGKGSGEDRYGKTESNGGLGRGAPTDAAKAEEVDLRGYTGDD